MRHISFSGILKRSQRSIVATAICAATIIAASAAAPKYIFFFIGDGMGIPQVTNAQLYCRNVLHSDTPLLMTTFPVVSMATTHSASSDVTDSAAAGTALSTGHKTKNGMLGMSSDTTAVTSIAKELFDNGYGVGIITSVAIDDATPGAFYTHVANRNQFYDIGRTLAESGYQFFAGAGLRGTKDKDGNDNGLLDYITKSGVKICYGPENIDMTANRLLVLNPATRDNPNCIGYTIDSIAGALTLPYLTEIGLKHMTRVSPDKFFMMVEGGNIDHAGHGNDGGTIVREVINFNQALQLAYDFYRLHPDETLILVTADHETGGMSVGCQTTGYSTNIPVASAQKISKERFNDYCHSILRSRMVYKWSDMEQYLAENLGFGTAVKLTEEEELSLRNMFDDIFEKHNTVEDRKTLYASFNAFTDAIFSLLNSKAGFGWTTACHTGTPVPVYAIGVGASRFSGLNDNIDLPRKIREIVGE